MIDGAGYEVSEETANLAVRCFAELWATGKFDCGPQDYDFMTHELLILLDRQP